jgi:acyl dehydratase
MTETNVSAAMRAALGSELSRRVSYPISESDIRRWAIAVYYPEPPPARFLDAEAAAKSRWDGIVAPEEFNPFAWAAVVDEAAGGAGELNDTNRTELSLGLPGPDLKFQLNGGIETSYGAPMRPGDVITAVSRLAEYNERTGRLGLMLFTTVEDTWINDRDEVVKSSRSTLIRY